MAVSVKAAFEAMVQSLGHQRIVSMVRLIHTPIILNSYGTMATVLNATLLVYDVILNLPLEIEHVWTRQWSFLTTLYVIQRYLPFFDTVGVTLHHNFGLSLSPRICTLDWDITAWSFVGGVMLSEILLTIRVWAVWERKIPVGMGLLVFFLACWVPCCILLARFLSTVGFETLPLPNFRGCFISRGSHVLYLCWVLWMVYDTGTLIMMLIPGISAYRRGGRSELFTAVYRDGVIYYAFIFLVSLINVVVVLTLPADLVHLLSSFERVLHSLLTSRAILHIRQVGTRLSSPPTLSYEVCTEISLSSV
ncbi:hypothetical protein E1B28_010793 [Marasmius oreades]|uniref:DUF6533 domain-containing protein n=1 Tax=Marasmius oreades TaxID=181124 RepID=A0A9P7RST8_9AGAR|nr:uncharacterized protein E1B28_010793 [Marasmius oreades]KAG7089084.1 hypothetical protein E1B28_010793 [Marasmius oreades]